MARMKVKLAYITDDSKRKATLNKRKKGLMKKVDEISTLCGIEACAIIYTPDVPQPEVWASGSGVESVISRFRSMTEIEQNKKKLTQESFLNERINKAEVQLRKLRNDTRKKELTLLMFHQLNTGNTFDNLSLIDLNDISNLIDEKLKEIERNINMSQAQEVKSEEAIVNCVQGQEMNVDAMQK